MICRMRLRLEPATGQSALYKMYQAARSWAPDAQALTMSSMPLTEVPTVPPGTAAAWQATFTSAAQSQARRYTYSIVESEGNLHKGVFASGPEGWSGPRGDRGGRGRGSCPGDWCEHRPARH